MGQCCGPWHFATCWGISYAAIAKFNKVKDSLLRDTSKKEGLDMPLDMQSIEQLSRFFLSTEVLVKDIKKEFTPKQEIRDEEVKLQREQDMLDQRKEALRKKTQVAIPSTEARRGGQVGFRRQRGNDFPDDEARPMKIKRERS